MLPAPDTSRIMKVGNYKILGLLIVFALGASVSAQDEGMYKIEKLPVSSKIYNDMTPVIMGDTVLFCSDRRFFGWRNDVTFDGSNLFSIYLARKEDSVNYKDVEIFSRDIQSVANEGPFCFTPDGKQIYFTRNIEVGKRALKKGVINNNNGIFIADRTASGWGNIRQFEYNDPLWQTAHPCISPDGKYLFFASNTPGGEGMSDIYMCEWVNGKWSEPVNLGPGINSPRADLYPWFSATNELYFASDREGGAGRLDIYTSRLSNGKFSRPVALPEPINSEYNDFAYITGAESNNGLFTSDRDQTDDIFKFSSLIIRKSNCDTLIFDRFCYEFEEENAVRFDSLPFEYEWDFDDGFKAQGVKAEHCFAKAGTYIVKLNVIDQITGDIQYNEVSYILDIRRTEQAFIVAPDSFNTGERVEFSASQTNLPGWDISEYYWNFDDGTIAKGINAEKAFSVPGNYKVQLIVTAQPDSDGIIRETCVSKIVVVNQQQ